MKNLELNSIDETIAVNRELADYFIFAFNQELDGVILAPVSERAAVYQDITVCLATCNATLGALRIQLEKLQGNG